MTSRRPPLAARILELVVEPGGSSAAEFGASVHAQIAAVRSLVRDLRMQVE